MVPIVFGKWQAKRIELTPFKINSLKKKFVLIVTALLSIVFIIEGAVNIYNSIKETRKNLSGQAVAFADLSTKPLSEAYDLYFDSGYYKFREVFQKILALNPSITKVEIVDVNGKMLLDSAKINADEYDGAGYTIQDKDTLEKVRSPKPVYVTNPRIGEEITEIYYPYFSDWGSHPYTLRYAVSYDQVKENIIKIVNQTVILILIIFALAVVLISWVINRLILSPVAYVNSVINRISQGKYGERIQVDTNDEIEQVADAVNIMAQTLQQNIIDLKELDKLKDEFIDVAAHNFRTPVTHIRLDTDFLQNRLAGKTSAKELEVLKDIESSNESLTLLIDDLLNITTLEKGKMKLVKFRPFDLIKVIKEAANIYGANARKKKITFTLQTSKQSPAEVLGDPPKIREVIGNILDNAFKFTARGGSVWLRLKEMPTQYLVVVEDTGIGISKEEIPKIFHKFHRATSTLTYDYEGRGLGLYISKLIVEAHNGRIWVESQVGKGSIFNFSLPKNLPDSPTPHHV